MPRRFIPSLLLVALLAAPLALAQDEPAATEPAAVTIDLVGHQQGEFFFTLEGQTERNPTLNVPPGAEVTLNLRSESGFHNIHVEGFPASPIIGPGDTTSVTFTAPESGTLTYQCDPHAPTMAGIIQVGAAAPPAPSAAPTEYTVVGHQEGGAFFFTIEGQTARNPTLYVAPGEEITVTFYSATGFHNFHVLDTDAKTGIVGPGQDPVVLTFTAPAEGTTWRYQCDPHAPGMAGNIVAGAPPSNGTAPPPPDNEITGPTVDLATLGYPECAGWLIPQSVTRGTAGGPVVRDYVAQCHAAGEEREAEADPYAGADLVIPTMWALIAVGVLGVFYVHKHYRP